MKNQKPNIELLETIARRAHYYAMQMIDIANHKREHDRTDPKVGGHPAASASALHILGTLHLWVKEPQDHLAIKPHASPADHSYNYLLKNLFEHQTLNRLSDDAMKVAMQGLRKFSNDGEPVFQSYHSGWDPDGLNFFPSGSVGIPPVMAAYLAHAYRFAEEHGYEVPKNAHFWSLIGDSEFREGSLYEAMPDAAEREIGTLTWIVDYNRQSLDGHRITNRDIMNGTDDDRIERTAIANGWEVIQVRHGRKRFEAFAKKDGDLLQNIFESGFDDYEYQCLLVSRDGNLIREAIVKKQPKLKTLLSEFKDNQLVELFIDMGGHDMGELIKAFEQSKVNKRKPTLIVAHTVKGWNLECLAVSGNHSMLPDDAEIIKLRETQGIPSDDVFARYPANSPEAKFLKERGDYILKGYEEQAAIKARNEKLFSKQHEQTNGVPEALNINLKMVPIVHTQWMLGQLAAKLTRISNTPKDPTKLKEKQKPLTEDELRWKTASELLVTMAPDVGTSTNLNPTMDGKIFGPDIVEDFETTYNVKDTKSPDIVPGEEISHRHLRFEIAEGNTMSCVGSYGKLREITGIPVIPLMTVYDFFIKRALDQLFYNLYWNSSFILVGTPAGVSLSPEGAQHGWKSDIQIPNMITWEPMFAVELDWILSESIRLHLENANQGRTGVVLRLVTRGIEQPEMLNRLRKQKRYNDQSDEEILRKLRTDVLAGAYYLVDYSGYESYEPGDNVVNIFAMGTMGTEALKASDKLLEKGVYANVIMVSSPDLLVGNLAYENQYHHLKNTLGINSNLHLVPHLNGDTRPADVVTLAGRRVPCVSVHDGEPGLLDNIGSIVGVKQESLAVRHHSKSGRPVEIYHYHHIDSDAVYEACGKVLAETALEQVVISHQVIEQAAQQGSTNAHQNWKELWPH
ncbi:MAG: pyruvate dehydrogenase [Oligoflexia bacterium]|nr:pyruvate dehydrogenase [Oligoflexia bacterium]